MEKHIHHMPHIMEGLVHAFVFIATALKLKMEDRKNHYMGDNFPFMDKKD